MGILGKVLVETVVLFIRLVRLRTAMCRFDCVRHVVEARLPRLLFMTMMLAGLSIWVMSFLVERL